MRAAEPLSGGNADCRTNRHARKLRRNSTDAEASLWAELRGRRLGGFKSRRQATAGHYLADFLCAERRLIVELDGGQHGGVDDMRRTPDLRQLGYHVIRFWNHEVAENLEGVKEHILSAARGLPPRFETRHPSSNSDRGS